MVAIFAFALAKYYITKSKTVSSGQPVWPPSPVLWPTYMLFGISLVTLLMNFFTLVAYCCGVGAANKTHTVGSILGFLFMGIHVVAWIVAAGAFRMGSNGIDLWGWTCGSEADKIEEQVQSFLDFGQLCTMQVCFISLSAFRTFGLWVCNHWLWRRGNAPDPFFSNNYGSFDDSPITTTLRLGLLPAQLQYQKAFARNSKS
jgi:hypothetical protein